MTMEDIHDYLRAVAQRPAAPAIEEIRASLAEHKQASLAVCNQRYAKFLWCWEQALRVQEHYLLAFRHLKTGDYYDAWCALERTELGLASLERHEKQSWSEFRLGEINAATLRWQALFPYRMFFSPEIVYLEKECSVCNAKVLPNAFCGHLLGEIYNGEMCFRTITNARILSISLVDKPFQKYSVAFMTDGSGMRKDNYKYHLVKYAASALTNPFDDWNVAESKRRQPHARFADVGRNDSCPCDSGAKYKRCCLPRAGVLRPHFQFTFAVSPPATVSADTYVHG
jgi:hypothetical protein